MELTEILENLAGVGKDCKPRMSIDQAEQAIRKWANKPNLSVREIEKIIIQKFFKCYDETFPDREFGQGGWLIEEAAEVHYIAMKAAQVIYERGQSIKPELKKDYCECPGYLSVGTCCDVCHKAFKLEPKQDYCECKYPDELFARDNDKRGYMQCNKCLKEVDINKPMDKG